MRWIFYYVLNNYSLNSMPLKEKFGRLFDLAENKGVSVAEMNELRWRENGETWKWCRRLFAWEELVWDCIERLTSIILQVEVEGRWVWTSHSSSCYTVSSAYKYMSEVNAIKNQANSQFLGLKNLSLMVIIFGWRLFLNRIN